MSNSELAKFTPSMDAAWKDLHSFLAAVAPSQASNQDQAGWPVKDHMTHLAVWRTLSSSSSEEAVGMRPLEAFYTASNFDEINEVIKVRLEGIALREWQSAIWNEPTGSL